MSSLRAKYEAYLAAPSSGALAEGASINYVPTLTTITEPTAILKHLTAQQKSLKKKSERVLSAIESSNGLCVDTETTIELIAGGGAFLPGLDDNFLADKTVIFPIIHIVQFDANQKISQIRLYWDQGSLLKQVEVIGSRSRNWPIRDGMDQIRLIARSATAEQAVAPEPSFSRRSTKSSDEVVINARSRGSTTSATGDPHASLSLFAPRDPNAEEDGGRFNGPSYARASSAKPPTRNLTDILGGPEDRAPDTPGPQIRSRSPAKGGASKNYGRIRLFDGQEPTDTSPERGIKTHSKKYNHFDFGDGEEAGADGKSNRNVKHQSQWNFEDFVTPDKPRTKARTQDKRTMKWDDVEEEQQGERSPVFRAPAHKPRPDAETHFEFEDDGTPAADKPKARTHNDGNMGLYNDNVTDQDDTKKPLTTVTNVNANDRARDFGAHYEIADNSPSVGRNGNGPTQSEKKPLDQNKQKILKTLDAKWSLFDDDAEIARKENAQPTRKIYKTANDGMGGNKSGAHGRSWGIGDDSAGEDDIVSKPRAGRSGGAKKQEEAKSFWDF